MDNKISLAGMSFPQSILFINDDSSVTVNTKDITEKIEYENKPKIFKTYQYVKKIPFIRGPAALFDVIFNALIKNKKYLLILCAVLIYNFFAPSVEQVSRGWFWDNYFSIIVMIGIIVYLFYATKNHGAEHKVISAFEDNQDLSLANIKKQPKENKRCGTVLVVWFFTADFLLSFILLPSFISTIISFSLAYEIFLLARNNNLLGKISYSLGWLGQKITTREPDDKLLLRAREGLIVLLDKDGIKYTP